MLILVKIPLIDPALNYYFKCNLINKYMYLNSFFNEFYRLHGEISRYQNALITWTECDQQLLELEMKFKGFGDDGGGNHKSGGFGSTSDSGMSDSGSEHELNEQEKRLVNLKQLANNLMTILTPSSEALSSILAVSRNKRLLYVCFIFKK